MAQLNVQQTSDPIEPIRLSDAVHNALEDYFIQMDNNSEACEGLYEMVLGEVERPLLIRVMHYCDGNKTLAAKILGMTRTTLRKKLEIYKLDEL